MTKASGNDLFRVVPLSKERVAVLDLLDFAARQHTVHGLIEVDVTGVRSRLRALTPSPSFTAFIASTVARSVSLHREVNARRAGRRLVVFQDIDMVVTVERVTDGGGSAPAPHIVRWADALTCEEVSLDLAHARQHSGRSTRGPEAVLVAMPSTVRRLGARLMTRVPSFASRLGPAVGVSSLGMFGQGGGWGIPLSPMTLLVTAGSVTFRPVFHEGEIAEREFLPLTLTFDHTVVDGAPAARFTATLRRLFESAAVLDDP